ncbi:MAG: DUF169 domain-containing protein [Methanomassiliicoccales archaeon]|nr:DUF169 domain-containing protein [Methanomassiliicoccales archaeon]
MDRERASKRLMEILGLKYEPVAITLWKDESLPQGYCVPEKPLRHCQALMRARKGEKLTVPADKQACPVGGSALGIVPLPEKVKAGEFHYNIGLYKDVEAARRMIEARPEMPANSVKATALSPLSKATVEPDVVVITGTPEQVYWIVPAASTYKEGGRVTLETASFQATCADSTLVPYLKRRVNISLGCFGCRKNTDIAPEEMLVGIPFDQLPSLLETLEKLAVKAIPSSRQAAPAR